MLVQNIGVSERQFLVTCQDKRETDQLLALGGQLDMNLGSCSISTLPGCGVQIPPPKVKAPRAKGQTISEAVDEFILRVLIGRCTPEETKLLPAILDRLYCDHPEGQRGGGGERL